MRLGILGGTFDPIHYAHLFIAEEARVRAALDRVLFIPNRLPPHKHGCRVTPARHRLRMAELAIAPNPVFGISRIELDRPGPSYTVDTLAHLHVVYPDAELCFITGLDSVLEMQSWHQPATIFQLCRVVAVSRPGFESRAALDALPSQVRARVDVLEAPALDISSTEIRDRVRAGLPIRYLTPDSVVDYVAEQALYRG